MAITQEELKDYKTVKQYISEGYADIQYKGKIIQCPMFIEDCGDIGFTHDSKVIYFYWIEKL